MQEQVGGYDIERCIGHGGMGEVYLGVHRVLGVQAAIKILQPQYARVPEMVERFILEAKATGRVQHPGIVKVFDSGFTKSQLPYLAMEFLQGEPLSEHLRVCGRLPLTEALCLANQLAVALAAAHAKGIIHRDLKPENIIRIAPGGGEEQGRARVKVVDFGIALMSGKRTTADGRRLTQQGDILGTPAYMAPEVVSDSRQASDRSDVYALGVLIHQMLAGEPPFTAETLGAILFKQVDMPPPALTRYVRTIPADVCLLVRRMLAKTPLQRPSMREVSCELARIEESLARPRSRLRVWGKQSRRALDWAACSLLVCAMGLNVPQLERKQLIAPLAEKPPQGGLIAAAHASTVAVAPAVSPAVSPPVQAAAAPVVAPAAPVVTVNRPRVAAVIVPRRPPLELAKQAYLERRYDEALVNARLAIKEQPYSAWQLIGQAGCMKADRQIIKEALYRLDAPHQSNVLFACQTQHIDLGDL